ncbi:MAG: phosphoribosylanthranilate isomerase [Coraliomargarita sp.]
MDRQFKIKICGLTRDRDVQRILELGADYCGFIVYPKSPRGLDLAAASGLASQVPEGKRVVVDVEPSVEQLKTYQLAGFDYFQIHTRGAFDAARCAEWSGVVGPERLWLAPRLAPNEAFPSDCLKYARTILLDTYSKNQVGGTGQTGDWGQFAELSKAHPDTTWILAGGLSPENALDAIAQTGAEHLDFNSGVESAPGVKDHTTLEALFRALGRV